MRVLYHHRTASRDGQSTHITEMIGALRGLGHTVDEVSPASDAPANASDGAAPAAAGQSLQWVRALKRRLPRFIYELAELAYSWVAWGRLRRAIEAQRPDFIYERYNLFLLAGVWAKRRYRLPLVLEVNAPMAVERAEYGGLSWPALARWAEHHVWRHADLVLPVTQVLADQIAAAGVPAQRILVVPNGINERHYAHLPNTEAAKAGLGLSGRLVVGFTGFVREWDRLDRIVAWVAQTLPRHPVHLLVIGDGPARAEIERVAAELGVADRVSFTGAVEREQVPGLSMAFDIALQTALVPYASPLCLFEYLRLGKAIVAPDQPNHHEVLRADVDAALYDPDDARGIETALDRLCDDAELRERLGRAAGQVVADRRLTWTEHARKIVATVASRFPLPRAPA